MDPKMIEKGRRLLLVEDYALARSASMRTLRAAYEVTAVASAEEALDWLAPDAFDVLLTDFQMPVMTGLELLEIARLRDPRLRRVLMSGAPVPGMLAHRATGLVHAFLYKPFNLELARGALDAESE
jgi:two-component system C4-dicarboxylate transport response regulator DctD